MLNILSLGGGTALPGLLVERYFPNVITKLSVQIPHIYLVSGTNGKTTTQRLLAYLLKSLGNEVISNPGGGNLLRGIASSLISNSNWTGKINAKFAVFEVEEATMPILTKLLSPEIIVLTNIFRDQLDAYGGIGKVMSDLKRSINQTEAVILLNGNDPRLQTLASKINNVKYYVGLDNKSLSDFKFEGNVNTDTKLLLEAEITNVHNDLSTEFKIQNTDYKFAAPGVYNVLNCLLALGVIKLTSQIEPQDLKDLISNFKPPWGRGESITIGGKTIRILLIKNPAGFFLALKTLSKINNLKLIIAINDYIADGKDVSWLWDVENAAFDSLNVDNIIATGSRAEDMQLRLKYTETDLTKVIIEKSFGNALDLALKNSNNRENIYILPTYTAMLRIREIIDRKYKNLDKFWK